MEKKKSELRSINRRIMGVTMPIKRKRTKWNRNWLCLCGSNKKFKNCCIKDIELLTTLDNNESIDELSKETQIIIENYKQQQQQQQQRSSMDD